jgi:hypothetical protein
MHERLVLRLLDSMIMATQCEIIHSSMTLKVTLLSCYEGGDDDVVSQFVGSL